MSDTSSSSSSSAEVPALETTAFLEGQQQKEEKAAKTLGKRPASSSPSASESASSAKKSRAPVEALSIGEGIVSLKIVKAAESASLSRGKTQEYQVTDSATSKPAAVDLGVLDFPEGLRRAGKYIVCSATPTGAVAAAAVVMDKVLLDFAASQAPLYAPRGSNPQAWAKSKCKPLLETMSISQQGVPDDIDLSSFGVADAEDKSEAAAPENTKVLSLFLHHKMVGQELHLLSKVIMPAGLNGEDSRPISDIDGNHFKAKVAVHLMVRKNSQHVFTWIATPLVLTVTDVDEIAVH